MIYVAIVAIPAGVPPYTVHQYLYGYFPQHPRDAERPFVFRQAGNRCLLVSRLRPNTPHIETDLTLGRSYAIEGLLSPEKRLSQGFGHGGVGAKSKTVPITDNRGRRAWFTERCARAGIAVGFCQWFDRESVQFRHSDGNLIKLYPAQVKAMGMVTDLDKARELILSGLGHGKAFGHGLLYLPELMGDARAAKAS